MYKIRFANDAVRDIERLDKSIGKRISAKILWLSENAESVERVWLRGEMAGFRKARVGDYRIIYELLPSQKLMIVHIIGHRNEVYKRN